MYLNLKKNGLDKWVHFTERIELFTIIEELQKRFEGKQVSEEGLKKQLNRLK